MKISLHIQPKAATDEPASLQILSVLFGRRDSKVLPTPFAAEFETAAQPRAGPVPRHEGWTPDRSRTFLVTLPQYVGVTEAAKPARIYLPAACRLRNRDAGRAFHLAREEIVVARPPPPSRRIRVARRTGSGRPDGNRKLRQLHRPGAVVGRRNGRTDGNRKLRQLHRPGAVVGRRSGRTDGNRKLRQLHRPGAVVGRQIGPTDGNRKLRDLYPVTPPRPGHRSATGQTCALARVGLSPCSSRPPPA